MGVLSSSAKNVAFLCVKSLLVVGILGKFNSDQPFIGENFDPAEADPNGAITCPGPLPAWLDSEWKREAALGSALRNATLQQLCAKPQYGGLPRAPDGRVLSARGWCRRDITEISGTDSESDDPDGSGSDGSHTYMEETPYVTFDHSYFAQGSPDWSYEWSREAVHDNLSGLNRRLLLFCATRCFCTYEWFDDKLPRTSAPLPMFPYEMLTGRPDPVPDLGFQITVDVQRDLSFPDFRRQSPHGFQGNGWMHGASQPVSTPMVEISFESQLVDQVWSASNHHGHKRLFSMMMEDRRWRVVRQWMFLNPLNKVICTGGAPSFELPAPFERTRFYKAQHICANAFSGGYMHANAGAYCHRKRASTWTLYPKERYRSDVWFADEMTPRLEWTWSHNFRFAAQLRDFCWRRCACDDGLETIRDPNTRRIFTLFQDLHIVPRDVHGQMFLRRTVGPNSAAPLPPGAQPGAQDIVVPLNEETRNDGVVNACGFSHHAACAPHKWPVDLLGPIPPDIPLDDVLEANSLDFFDFDTGLLSNP
ncbi:MAG: hypothetical protein M1833_000051 [Piccolia ochrophora]|nr:MAG: hypothetical protein M1833_000051 [Piccolia ochrophora]